MTNLQLINETIEAYKDKNNRATYGITNQCMYMTKDGKKCAIGRLINEDKLLENGLSFEKLNEIGGLPNLIGFLRKKNLTVYDILIDDVKGKSIELLNMLQDYHDNHYDDVLFIEELKRKYTERESVLN